MPYMELLKGFCAAAMTALLAVAAPAQAADVLTIGSAEGSPGSEVEVSVDLANTTPIAALQIAIPLDGNTHYIAGSAKLSERCAGSHTVSARETGDTVRVIVVSQQLQTIGAGSGRLFSLRLALGRKPGSIPLQATGIIATDAGGNRVDIDSPAGATATTRCALATLNGGDRRIDFGRVPIRATYTRQLTISNDGNAPLTVEALEFSSPCHSSPTALPLTIEAGASREVVVSYAPVERGEAEDTLRVVSNSVSRLNTVKLTAAPYAVNELHIACPGGESDAEATVSISMNNMDAVSGFQMDFVLPTELQYIDGSFALSGSASGLSLSAGQRDGRLTAVAYSTAGATITPADEAREIASFRVKLIGPYSANLSFAKAVLTAKYRGETLNVVSAAEDTQVSIQSPSVSMGTSIDMGRTPTSERVSRTLSVSNYGGARLKVSRATFSEEGFEIAEQLPLEVGSWESKQITVVYNGQESKPVNATLRLYTNDPTRRMVSVDIRGERYITNAVHPLAGNAFIGRRAELKIGLENTFDIKALQFDVVYPHGVFTPYAADSIVAKTARMGDMTITTRTVGDTVKVRAYSLSGEAIAAGSGEAMSLFFNTAAGIAEGSATFSVANIRLSRSQTEEVHSDIVVPTVAMGYYVLGDVNRDGKVDIADAAGIVSYTLKDAQPVFRPNVADYNGDGKIDIADAAMVVTTEVVKDK